jgi:hypothetical protein
MGLLIINYVFMTMYKNKEVTKKTKLETIPLLSVFRNVKYEAIDNF